MPDGAPRIYSAADSIRPSSIPKASRADRRMVSTSPVVSTRCGPGTPSVTGHSASIRASVAAAGSNSAARGQRSASSGASAG